MNLCYLKLTVGLFLLALCGSDVGQAQQCGPANPNCVINGGTFSGIKVVVRSPTTASDQILLTDYFICPLNSSVAATETLPPNPIVGLTFLVKDCNGTAVTHTITVQPSAGTIDGAATFVMNTNFQSAAFTYNGTQWSAN